jgi:pimeloyl-ACP methyl ester carboxylesterase
MPQRIEAMQTIDIRPGLSIAYEDDCFAAPWSTPQSVLLVHGNSESSHAWTQWVPYLASRYRVIRLDLPGFGASTAPPDYRWTAPEVAADIARFLDALGIERCHLIGAKYGGSISLQLASDQPERFLSLTIFGSPARGVGTGNADKIRAKGVRQWAAETMRARLGSTASEAQIAWWTELMGATDQRAALGSSSALVTMDLDDRLPLIAAPSLIVTTQESGLQAVEAVKRYAARIPNARVIVLDGDSYHIAAVKPDVCARHALAFMEEVAERRSTAIIAE